MKPFMWGIPLALCFVAAGVLTASVTAVAAGRYFEAIGFAGIFLLCCWGTYRILKQRMDDRFGRR